MMAEETNNKQPLVLRTKDAKFIYAMYTNKGAGVNAYNDNQQKPLFGAQGRYLDVVECCTLA